VYYGGASQTTTENNMDPNFRRQLARAFQNTEDGLAYTDFSIRSEFPLNKPQRIPIGDGLFVYYIEHNDGSTTFRLERPIAPPKRKEDRRLTGVNGRLNVDRMRSRKNGTKDGRPTTLHSRFATELWYDRTSGYCNMPFFTITGDLGRAHYPQQWAYGILPIISVRRAAEFTRTWDAELLHFNIPTDRNEMLWMASAYYVLLREGWNGGFVPNASTTRHFSALLRGVGFPLKSNDIYTIHMMTLQFFNDKRVDLTRGRITKPNGVDTTVRSLVQLWSRFADNALIKESWINKNFHQVNVTGVRFAMEHI